MRRIAQDPAWIEGYVVARFEKWSFAEMADFVERELVGRPDAPDGAVTFVRACREGMSIARLRLAWSDIEFGPPGSGGFVEAYEPVDEREAALLEEIAAKPADEAARSVYADWLEERGETERDARAWRAIVSKERVDGKCEVAWNECTATGYDNLRNCPRCGNVVAYVFERSALAWVRHRKQHFVLDRLAAEEEMLEAQREMRLAIEREEQRQRELDRDVRVITNPPRPGLELPVIAEETPGIVTRIGRWFRRRAKTE